MKLKCLGTIMSKKSASGRGSRMGREDHCLPVQTKIEQLNNPCEQDFMPEMCGLRVMEHMIGEQRREILRLRWDYKKLRNLNGTQGLAVRHMTYKLALMDDMIHRNMASYKDLRDDYRLQRACVLRQKARSGKAA